LQFSNHRWIPAEGDDTQATDHVNSLFANLRARKQQRLHDIRHNGFAARQLALDTARPQCHHPIQPLFTELDLAIKDASDMTPSTLGGVPDSTSLKLTLGNGADSCQTSLQAFLSN
jgi:hypothetical protein